MTLRIVLAATYTQALQFARSRQWDKRSWRYPMSSSYTLGLDSVEVYRLSGWQFMIDIEEIDERLHEIRNRREMSLNFDVNVVVDSPKTWNYCWPTDERFISARCVVKQVEVVGMKDVIFEVLAAIF